MSGGAYVRRGTGVNEGHLIKVMPKSRGAHEGHRQKEGSEPPEAARAPPEQQAGEASGSARAVPVLSAWMNDVQSRLDDVQSRLDDIEKLQEARWEANQARMKIMEDWVKQHCAILRKNFLALATTGCNHDPSEVNHEPSQDVQAPASRRSTAPPASKRTLRAAELENITAEAAPANKNPKNTYQ